MRDKEKSATYRPQHLDYLAKMEEEGHIFAKGPFLDGSGGLVIYRGESLEKVESLVENDPYIVHKARSYDIREWGMVAADAE